MRLSTHQFFQQGVASITDLTAQTKKVQQQIASGKRLETAADDPGAATRILKLETEIETGDQYARNMDLAESRLLAIENAVASVETVVLRIRELTIQAGDGALTNAERGHIAVEMSERVDELADLVNTRDRDGAYIFGGFSVDRQPFVESAVDYRYSGDEGVQLVQIASGSYVAISESGSEMFANIPVENNRVDVSAAAGNFGAVSVVRSTISDQAAYDAVYPEDFNVTFGDVNNVVPAGPNYTITRRSDGAVLQANVPYDPIQGVSFSGIDIGFDGVPAVGDQFLVDSSQSNDMLSTLKNLADNVARFSDPAERDAFLADSLNNIDNIQNTLSRGRARVGARLNTIDTTRETLADNKLANQQILSNIRDLDYAEAVSSLSFLSFVLEASQQSLARVAGLSLFNFLR